MLGKYRFYFLIYVFYKNNVLDKPLNMAYLERITIKLLKSSSAQVKIRFQPFLKRKSNFWVSMLSYLFILLRLLLFM